MQTQTTVKIDCVKGPREQQNREKEGRWDVQINAWFLMERSRKSWAWKGKEFKYLLRESFNKKRPVELMVRRLYKGGKRWKVWGKYREAGKRWRGHKNREEENNGEGRKQMEEWKWTKKRENHPNEAGNKIESMFHALERFVTQL